MIPEYELSYNLAGPCGYYCGTCGHYLARSKGRLAQRGLKDGCKGCRAQDKKCAWVKRDCVLLRKHQIAFCFECVDFPCANLLKLNARHVRDDGIDMLANLERIREVGVEVWLAEQEALWRCPACGGQICVEDKRCFDCGEPV